MAGDEISLNIVIEAGAGLLLLTQGSTKVFRVRPGLRPLSLGPRLLKSGTEVDQSKTIQRQHIRVGEDAFLLLLPNAVQPYASSSYHQAQRVSLTGKGSSVILLDWFTAGRSLSVQKTTASGVVGCGRTKEEWEFERYSSLNEVVLDGEVIMRERMVLENDQVDNAIPGSAPTSTSASASSASTSSSSPVSTEAIPSKPTLADRMRPYQTYATILIYGPHFHALLAALQDLSQDPNMTQFQAQKPNGTLLWSFSLVGKSKSQLAGAGRTSEDKGGGLEGQGGVLRVAGGETEVVAEFIRGVLERGDVERLVGKGLWERIW